MLLDARAERHLQSKTMASFVSLETSSPPHRLSSCSVKNLQQHKQAAVAMEGKERRRGGEEYECTMNAP